MKQALLTLLLTGCAIAASAQEEIQPLAEEAAPVVPGRPEASPALLSALERIGQPGLDAQAAAVIAGHAAELAATDGPWPATCRLFFQQRMLDPSHVTFWNTLAASTQAETESLVHALAVFAAESLAADLAYPRERLYSLDLSLRWLEQLAADLAEEYRPHLRRALGRVFKVYPALVLPMLRAIPTDIQTAETALALRRLGMQTCLDLALFAEPTTLIQWLELTPGMEAFLERAGLLLFGHGALSAAQTESLATLYTAVPAEVHGVWGLIVPDEVGLSAGAAGLRAPGLILDVAPIPLDVPAAPDELRTLEWNPFVPEFTLAAAVQLMRAVQFLQFNLRPELQHRRDRVLEAALAQGKMLPRYSLDTQIYAAAPDDLLPATAYLWFADSEQALYLAASMLGAWHNEAMETLLLIADTLSGDANTAKLFRCGADGRVSAQSVAISRSSIEPGLVYATGIGVGDEMWYFHVGPFGALIGASPGNAETP